MTDPLDQGTFLLLLGLAALSFAVGARPPGGYIAACREWIRSLFGRGAA